MASVYSVHYEPSNDYYRALGVPPTASSTDIHRAYRERAKQVHPDLNPRRQEWAHTQFTQLNHIHDILSNPVLKDEYDRQRAAYLLSLFGEPQAPAQEPERPPARTKPYTYTYPPRTAAPVQRQKPRSFKFLMVIEIVLGICMILVGVSIGIFGQYDPENLQPVFIPLTLDDLIALKTLPDAASVKLTGLDCSSLKGNDNHSEAILPSKNQHTLAVIMFSDIRTCPQIEQATITGSVQLLDSGMYNKLMTDGAFVNYPKATNFIYICQNCGSSAHFHELAVESVILVAVFVGLIGLFMACLGMSKLPPVARRLMQSLYH